MTRFSQPTQTNRRNVIGTFLFYGIKGIRQYLLIKNTFNRYSILLRKDSEVSTVYAHKNIIAYCYHYVYDTEMGHQPQESYVSV